MLSAFNILLIAAFLCVILLLVLSSLLRSGSPGVKTWFVANVLATAAFILYALGRELPPLLAYEAANGVYAAAAATVLVGFRQFFARQVYWTALGVGIALVVAFIALFHYWFDSFALRTVTVSVSQAAVCLAIGLTIIRSRNDWRSRYPYFFTVAMSMVVAAGHGIRAIIYVAKADQLTSLLQPSPWNLFFVSAGTMVLPVLTLGGVMMVHDRLMAEAEHAANRDFLTGAWSRRAFFELAERELSRARRVGRSLSLLVLDLDNFKTINDTAGHAAGDRVLVDIVSRAATAIRSVDYFARIGGEEFAVLLPETDRSAALIVAERLRAALERPASASTKGSPGIAAYTASIGLAVLRDSEPFQELLRRADAALYEAKASGRNRVVCEPDVVQLREQTRCVHQNPSDTLV